MQETQESQDLEDPMQEGMSHDMKPEDSKRWYQASSEGTDAVAEGV